MANFIDVFGTKSSLRPTNFDPYAPVVVSGPDAMRLGALDDDALSALDDRVQRASPDQLLYDAHVQQQIGNVAANVLGAGSTKELAQRLMAGADHIDRVAGVASQAQGLRNLAASGDPHAIANTMMATLSNTNDFFTRVAQRQASSMASGPATQHGVVVPPPTGAMPRPKPRFRNNPGYPSPMAAHVQALLDNPHLRNEFEWLYGSAENLVALSDGQIATLPQKAYSWSSTKPRDPATRPRRGDALAPLFGGRFTDGEGNRIEPDQLPNGAYRLPDEVAGKRHPVGDNVLVPTEKSIYEGTGVDYYSGVFDPFGLYRTQTGGGDRRHTGIDVPAKIGTPVGAMASGRVYVQRNVPGFGNVVGIEHPDGTMSTYAHLKDVKVNDGDEVLAGDDVGTVGISGRPPGSNRTHLHIEILAANRSRGNGARRQHCRRRASPPSGAVGRPNALSDRWFALPSNGPYASDTCSFRTLVSWNGSPAAKNKTELLTSWWLPAVFDGMPTAAWSTFQITLYNLCGMAVIGLVRNAMALAPIAFAGHLGDLWLYTGAGITHGFLYWLAFKIAGHVRLGEALVGATSWLAIAFL